MLQTYKFVCIGVNFDPVLHRIRRRWNVQTYREGGGGYKVEGINGMIEP